MCNDSTITEVQEVSPFHQRNLLGSQFVSEDPLQSVRGARELKRKARPMAINNLALLFPLRSVQSSPVHQCTHLQRTFNTPGGTFNTPGGRPFWGEKMRHFIRATSPFNVKPLQRTLSADRNSLLAVMIPKAIA